MRAGRSCPDDVVKRAGLQSAAFSDNGVSVMQPWAVLLVINGLWFILDESLKTVSEKGARYASHFELLVNEKADLAYISGEDQSLSHYLSIIHKKAHVHSASWKRVQL